MFLKNVSVVGVHWGANAKNDPGMIPKVWDGLIKLIEQGSYGGIVYGPEKRYEGLDDVNRALSDLEKRRI